MSGEEEGAYRKKAAVMQRAPHFAPRTVEQKREAPKEGTDLNNEDDGHHMHDDDGGEVVKHWCSLPIEKTWNGMRNGAFDRIIRIVRHFLCDPH